MRCAPLAVAYRDNTDRLAEVSRESSLITHADPRCTYGCAVLNRTVAGYLRDEPNPLASALDQVCSDAPDELVSALAPVADGTEFESLSTSGYVVDSLQTALHDAVFAESAEDAIVTAVNRGGDADTIGAITGAVAGARFGAQDLPERWLSSIDERDELTRLAERLVELEEE
jgi:ADP-ribosyl-[dinitrogen reductase] hydrolase